MVFLFKRFPKSAGWTAGLLIASKQTMIWMPFLLPLLFVGKCKKWWQPLLVAMIFAMLTCLPFFLWNPAAFWKSSVALQFIQPFRPDALSFPALFYQIGLTGIHWSIAFPMSMACIAIAYWKLPQERIRHLDINGGEPSYSKNYKKILANLPPNLRTLRLNTNCNIVLGELTEIAQRGIEVTVTVSCDGIGPVHEFMRWPIPWETFYLNLMQYKTMPVRLNLWTTVSILNVDDLPNIQTFAQEHGIDHSYAYLKQPYELSVDNTDLSARQTYISKQKQLRGIK
jgi:hypothetical protein